MSTMEAFYRECALEPAAHVKRYQGIPMLCEDGLHELIAAEAAALLPKGASVLDVGCGQGALSLRLADQGFRVDACDQFDHCKCKDRVTFIHERAEDAAVGAAYDAIFLVELLEHVEAPFALLKRYAGRLKPGGRLFVSTPNVDSDLSRAWFFLKGRHWYFDEQCVERDGHITPIHAFQVRHHCRELGLSVVSQRTVLENRAPRGAFGAAVLLLRAFQLLRGAPRNDGKIALWVLQA